MNAPFAAVFILIAAVVLGAIMLVSRRAGPVARHVLAGLGLLLASLPLGVILTLVLLPLWRWIEERFEIESVGHSGPATWCYLVTMLACVLALASLYVARVRRRSSASAARS